MLNISRRCLLIGQRLRFCTKSKEEGPVTQRIREKLLCIFQPSHLDVKCESYMHNVPRGAEKHFKVIIVCSQFKGIPLAQRHRLVNKALADELASEIHALSIDARDPSQWDATPSSPPSPPCLGGANR